MLRIRFDQLREQRGPDPMPAVTGFNGESELGRSFTIFVLTDW